MLFPVRRKGAHDHLPSSFGKFSVLFSKCVVSALQLLCCWRKWWHKFLQGWQRICKDMFSPSPDEWNMNVVLVGGGSQLMPSSALPCLARAAWSAAGVPGGAAQQIRKFCEPFIVYSESMFCSVEADCSSGQFQVLTAGPPSPSSPPLPVWDERGEVWMHIEQWS